MRSLNWICQVGVGLLMLLPWGISAQAKTHHATTSGSHARGSSHKATSAKKRGTKSSVNGAAPCHSKKCRKVVVHKGQQRMDPARTTQIQRALIQSGYMSGEPSGEWDAASQTAMLKYQADNGWQSKVTPDSRALIKLGLGPSHDGLMNPDSAMTALPETVKDINNNNNAPSREH